MENAAKNGELMEIFYEETQRLIDEMRRDMSTLSQGIQTSDRSSVARRLFRCAHIVRSSSRAVGLDGLEQISGALERIFKKACDELVPMGGDTISLLCESVEACQRLLNDKEVVGHKELMTRLDGILQPCGG